MRPRKPKLPLQWSDNDEWPCAIEGAQGETLMPEHCAWLNRAAAEWPKLRRALREAIDEIEANMSMQRLPTEDEVERLGRLCDALGPDETRRFTKIWRKKR